MAVSPAPGNKVIRFPARTGNFRPQILPLPSPEPLFTDNHLRLKFVDTLGPATRGLYSGGLRTIYLNRQAWDTLSGAERRHLVCHELAHHLLCTTYSMFARDDVSRRRIRRVEGATDAFAAHLASLPGVGALLTTAGVLAAQDGAWLDGVTAVEDVIA